MLLCYSTFDYFGRIGDAGYRGNRNSIKGVIFTLHGIITRDRHFRDVPHDKRNRAVRDQGPRGLEVTK